VENVARIGQLRNVYKISIESPEEKGMLLRRWEDNIKMDLKYGGRVWIGFKRFRVGSCGRDFLTY
jgi:hypothetical protein